MQCSRCKRRSRDVLCARCQDCKYCPRCDEWLERTEFGICRARKDGLNLYCKKCIRAKIALSRQSLREYKAARSKYEKATVAAEIVTTIAAATTRRMTRMMRKLTPCDRVLTAIRAGAHTQKEIIHVTKLPKDEVCDALANLLLWTREITTAVINHVRMYFIADDVRGRKSPPVRPSREPRSFGVSNIYFSAIGEKA